MQTPGGASIDQRELDQFERLGEDWWSEKGPMRPLHRMNPVRVRWMRDAMIDHFAALDGSERDPDSLASLAGLSILDIGCGGGILCEPLSRLGADVLGIDPAQGNIDIARAHAEETGAPAKYRAVTAEDLAGEDARFDVVSAMEVVEHVVNPAAFIKTACSMVKPGGLFFCSTLNRTAKSFALAIVGAEYVLRWVPPGTHQWEKFVTPGELEDAIKAAGLDLYALSGVSYNPLRDSWDTSRDLDVNYMVVARRLMQMA
jgi:2-polyprenyl-6-hydroxyphenyl methylase/3-demethylubiquinone-9 3-methyltransferase